MSLRDAVEDVLRSWDAYETGRGNASLIDYDCHPTDRRVERARDRIEVLTQLNELFKRAKVEENRP